MALTREQEEAISEALTASKSCAARAAKCASLGLMVLAREYEYYSREMPFRVDVQRRTLETSSAVEPEVPVPGRSEVRW